MEPEVLVVIDLSTYVKLPDAPVPLSELTNYLEDLQDEAKLEKPPLRKIVSELTQKFKEEQEFEEYLAGLDEKVRRNALAAIMIDEIWVAAGQWFQDHQDTCGLGAIVEGKLRPLSNRELDEALEGKDLKEASEFCFNSLATIFSHHTREFLARCETGEIPLASFWIKDVFMEYRDVLKKHPVAGLRQPHQHLMAGFATAAALNFSGIEVTISLMNENLFAQSFSVQDFQEISQPMLTLIQYLATSHLNVTGAIASSFRSGDSGITFNPEAFVLLDREIENPELAVTTVTMQTFKDRLVEIVDLRTGCPANAISPNVVTAVRQIAEKIGSTVLWKKAKEKLKPVPPQAQSVIDIFSPEVLNVAFQETDIFQN